MEYPIRENIPVYMEELKKWLAEIEETPLEEMSDFFRARIGDYEDHMSLWQRGYEHLAELVPETAKNLLDLGCGTGLELDVLFRRRRDLSVTGIDLCQEMLDKLREKHPHVNAICADYFSAELGEEKYDCAVSFESLHHFAPEKKRGLYEKIYRALRKGGVFLEADYLACCPEEETLLAEFCRRKRREQNIPETRFVHFDTPLTVEHEMVLLKNAGFSRVEWLESVNGASILRGWR